MAAADTCVMPPFELDSRFTLLQCEASDCGAPAAPMKLGRADDSAGSSVVAAAKQAGEDEETVAAETPVVNEKGIPQLPIEDELSID